MTHTRLLHSALAAIALFSTTAAVATTPPPVPSWYHYGWELPHLTGDYLALNGGSQGSMTINVTDDARLAISGALYYYDALGNPVVQATSGLLTVYDDPTVSNPPLIASGDITSYFLANGQCRGCPPTNRTATDSGDSVHWDWTGPRAGTLTVNGVSQAMVHAYSGPPLVAPPDFAGTWLLVHRDHGLYYGGTPAEYTFDHLWVVRIVPVTEPRHYVSALSPNPTITPFGSAALPPPGARLFDLQCVSAGCYLGSVFDVDSGFLTHRFTMWITDDGVGRLMGTSVTTTNGVTTDSVMDAGRELPRAYGTVDRVISRQAQAPNFPAYRITETALTRIDSDTLQGDWAP